MPRRSLPRIGSLVAATTAVLAGTLAGAAPASAVIGDPFARLEPVDAAAVVAVPDRAPECDVVVYTPASAQEPMSAEWCVPAGHGGDAVVLVHGGGGYEGDPGDVGVWRDEHLAAGRATLVIEYTLLDVGSHASVYPRPEQNVMAAVQWVRLQADGDVVVHGFSAGARLAAIVATATPDPAFAGSELHAGVSASVDGAILFYGYYDGSQFHGGQYYGAAVEPAEATAIDMATADDPPVLIVHGTDDVMTDPAGAVEFAAALDAAGGEVELVLVEGENHVFDGYGTDRLTDAGAALVPTVDAFFAAVEITPGW